MKIFSFLLLFLTSGFIAHAQNIQGVINIYTPVLSFNTNTVSVGSTTGFAIGDQVMVIKMKGATINQTNTTAYGDTVALNSAGRYQFCSITSITGNDVTLFPFCNIYGSADYVQMVSVPEYASPTVTGNLTCAPWNGTVGGVLVFETSGTLTLNDSIDVSGQGFRGGQFLGGSFNCGSTAFFASLASNSEGEKGEGIADYITGQECGGGKLANGGGGAYAGNAGGGGGGNGGTGGQGGDQYSGCSPTNKNGIGGLALARANNHIFVGGGGGGPERDNNQTIFPGGNGGGLVYITANNIVGNNQYILSNGDSVQTFGDEGGAGGGAGGSIYLVSPSFTGTLNVEANGGNGSSNFNNVFTAQCHGPGGGGGGGLVAFGQAVTPAGVITSFTGGQAGIVLNPSSSCYNTTYNAAAGSSGQDLHNFVCFVANPIAVNLGPDQPICSGQTLTLDAGAGYSSYVWDDPTINSQTRQISAPGIYYVFVVGPDGCTGSDTIEIYQDSSAIANFTYTIDYGCDRDTVYFTNASIGDSSYIWLFGDGNTSTNPNPTHIYGAQGNYTVRLVAGTAPCFDTIDQSIFISHSVQALIGLSGDSICLGDQILVDDFASLPNPAQGTRTSVWDFGDGTISTLGATSHTYSQSGVYILTLIVTDSIGCVDSAQQAIFVDALSYTQLSVSDDTICVGQGIQFYDSVGQGALTYNWNFGDGNVLVDKHNPAHSYSQSGSYTATLLATYLICPPSSQDTIITVQEYPLINLGADREYCPGRDSIVELFNIENPSQLLNWSTGVRTDKIYTETTGRYWATVSQNGCSSADSVWVKRHCYLNIPNSFSPNGDGRNDYFIPRSLLAAGLREFSMKIFNRWGELIFETNQVDGRGWDGKYNGQEQPIGVYVYMIEAQWDNGYRNSFKGNVTLLR